MIISHYEAEQLLEAKKKRLKNVEISLDFNITKTKIQINNNFFIFQ